MIIDHPKIQILLSLKNGERFLLEFLDSLAKQTRQDFTLLVRDDNSQDSSVEIVKQWSGRISWHSSSGESYGVVRSYSELLNSATGDYIMFADQDDVWHSNKIEQTLAFMQKQEERLGKDTPILVHADLAICDEKLNLIHSSLVKYQSLAPDRTTLKDLMLQNSITGCTMMINRSLAELLAPIPQEAICFDWYIGLVAAAFGQVSFLPEALIDYRQHNNNVYGAVCSYSELKNGRLKRKLLHKRLIVNQVQARAFAHQYVDKLSPKQLDILKAWSELEFESSYLKRLRQVIRYKFCKNSLLRTLGLWWAI